ncbi:MAG: extracellular solute-binding protein [Chloroflexi bacterium]|nr:extracellular solute-binding protein [Chloroflexota bacterium]
MGSLRASFSRRYFLRTGALAVGSVVLAACGQSAPASSPAAPASGAQPTAAKPAPAATAKPAAPAAASPAASPAASGAAASSAAASASKPAGKALSGKMVFMDGIASHAKLAQEWGDKFKAQNPGVDVTVQFIAKGEDMVKQLLVQTAGGTPPDVFTYFQENIPITAAIEKNLLLDLDDRIKGDNYDLSDFLPQAIELNKWDGKIYALPRDYGNQQIYYNVDLFKKKGVPLPATDWTDTTWTFDRYLEAAKAITEESGGQASQFGLVVNTAWRPWATFVYCNGGKIVNTDSRGIATSFAVGDDSAVEALQFLQDLIYKHKVAPPPSGTSAWSPDLGPVEVFGTNKVGMLLGNPSQVQAFRKITAFEWNVAPIPVGKGGKRGTGGGGTAWSIAKSSKNPDAAWGMLTFITSAQAQLDEVAAGATTPSRKSVVTSKEFQDPNQPPKNAKSFAEAQSYVVRDPVNSLWSDIFSKAVVPNIQLLFAGKSDAKTVAKQIKDQGDSMWAKT